MIYDLIVIGSGPAGYTAGIYAKRAGLNVLIITGYEIGGQLTTTTHIENWPGNKSILGGELMDNMKEHAVSLDVKIITDYIKDIDISNKPYILKSDSQQYTTQSVIIATGSSAKWLGTESENKFKGYGVSACATCDGFFYKDKPVAVIGGGNTALEEALYLSKIASKVFLIHRRDSFRGEKIMQDRVLNNPKIEVIWNSTLQDIMGEEEPRSMNKIQIKNTLNNDIREIDVDGLFIAIGHNPNTSFVKGKLDLDEDGYLLGYNGTLNAMNSGKPIDGIYCAGDVIDKHYKQAIVSAGLGCRAALDAKNYIDSLNN